MSNLDRREFLKRSASLAATGTFLGHDLFGKTANQRKPNVVYVLTDQWRAQATGYAGDPNVKTPNLDALAARSVNFENAVSVCPVCTPHRASLMTGRYPLSTGMFLNDLYLPSEELCMAEIFKSAGYNTGYIGKWHLDGHGRSTFIPKERRQGFDYWKVLECTHKYNDSKYYANDDKTLRTWDGYDAYAQTKDAQAYISDHAKQETPFLLMISYGGPHFPHHTAPDDLKAQYPLESIKLRPNVPKKWQERATREVQGYYAHCTALDRCVGDLLTTLKETETLDDTIFVFTSDHGEMMGSQGQPPREKQRPWDESIRVPFLITHPARLGNGGRKVKAPINTPDILPTLLGLTGIAAPETLEGEDLTGLITAAKPDSDRAALVMSVTPFGGYKSGKEFRGIRTQRYTYVRATDGPWLLYDNDKDPYQLKNVAGDASYASVQKELDDILTAKLNATSDRFLAAKDYVKEWNYEVGKHGSIPYWGKPKVQSPANRSK